MSMTFVSIDVTYNDCFVSSPYESSIIYRIARDIQHSLFSNRVALLMHTLMRCTCRFLTIDNRKVIMRSQCPAGNSISLMSDMIPNPTSDSGFYVDGLTCQ